MLIFLDTEFTDFIDCDLISIGMVSEDGKYELYEERSDFCTAWCNQFVRAAVLPQLGKAAPALDREHLKARLFMWFAALPPSVTLACDSFTDWELLLDALDGSPPPNLSGRYDLTGHLTLHAFHNAVTHYHKNVGPWHHALHDARAIRLGWLASQSQL